ncbi:hypothetical protein G9A89_018965 [Geosiphon pyriformis]|nr:hypothetical protein G9A89_018965 [Geosiphon pyriformis]
MEDPLMELSKIINGLLATDSTFTDPLTMREYFTEDVEFRHPLIMVNSGTDSREHVLSVYKYARGLSWNNQIKMHEVWFNPMKRIALVHYTQYTHPLLFPYLKISMKTITQLEFQQTKDNKWLISRLEDNIPNEDILNVLIPFSRPFLNYFKAIGGLAAVGIGRVFEKWTYHKQLSVHKKRRIYMSSFRILRTASKRGLHTPRTLYSTTNYSLSLGACRTTLFPFGRILGRGFGSAVEQKSGGGSSKLIWAAAGLVGFGAGYYIYSSPQFVQQLTPAAVEAPTVKKGIDYQKVYNQIADILEDHDYDDGSYGPVLLRLAWHAAGTYDKETGTGGSNGATMRFEQEGGYSANNGLAIARNKLEQIKAKNPEISYSDLWSLAGVVAVQELGGPTIPWRPGRADAEASTTTPDGRLPDATQGPKHIRDIFYRMGFDDREIVVLSGAHALGRCHSDRSGFDGPWTFSPVLVTNNYYTELLEQKWVEKKWKGPKQYVDKATGTIMMLPTDMALIQDKAFKPWVEKYAKDEKLWFEDFAVAFKKLLELGVPFTGNEKEYRFHTTVGTS